MTRRRHPGYALTGLLLLARRRSATADIGGCRYQGLPAASHGSVTRAHRVELNSINERILVDRPSVRCTPAQRLAIEFARSSDVCVGDRREGDKLYGVDLDLIGADPVSAALLDTRPLPQPDRERDVSGQNIAAQIAAELDTRDASL